MKHRLNTDLSNPITMGLASGQITEKIIGASFEVHKNLGYGFLERVYQKALQFELQQLGLNALCEHQIKVYYKGIIVGDYVADLLVANEVLVEIKVASHYNTENEAQLLNELKAMRMKVGLLLNFGRTKIEFKRFVF